MFVHLPRRKKSKLTASLKAFFLAAATLASPYAYQKTRVALEAPEPDYHADALIVPTGYYGRILAALEMKRPEQILFISGAGTTEKGIQKWLSEFKGRDISLENEKIIIGNTAVDTHTNAAEIVYWLKHNPEIISITIVSSNYHLPRLRLELERVLPNDIEVRYAPCDPLWSDHARRGYTIYFYEALKTFGTLTRWSRMMSDIKHGTFSSRIEEKDIPKTAPLPEP